MECIARLIGAANQLVIFLGIFATITGTLIKVSKMCRALTVRHRMILVSEFDAAEKLHQTYFAFIASSHNALYTNATPLHADCNAIANF